MRPALQRGVLLLSLLPFSVFPLACDSQSGVTGEGGGGLPSELGGAPLPSGGGPGELPAGAPPAPQPPPPDAPVTDARCVALGALPTLEGDLTGWLNSVPIAAANSEGFQAPAQGELTAFQTHFSDLLEAGPTPEAVGGLKSLGFSVSRYRDGGGGQFLVIEEDAPRSGAGTFVVNTAPARDVWLEAPHADYDEGTLRQSAVQLTTLGARALLINGSHRCANAEPTPCGVSTVVCGGKMRVSDSAHNEHTYFTAAHKALRASHPNGIAVSVHGMDAPGPEAAVISNGTREDRPDAISNRLRDAMNRRLTGSTQRAFSCNDASEDGEYRPLCGTSNVQGRFDNGSSNACTTQAPAAQDRFIHLEQDAALRAPPAQGPGLTTEALAEIVPCSLGGSGLGCTATTPVCP